MEAYNFYRHYFNSKTKTKRKKYQLHKPCPTVLFFRPRENIKLEAQRELFALRTKMNHIKANFCSSKEIEKCNKCQCEMDNEHLFKCTRRNPNDISYNHILNGTIIEQRYALNYMKEIQTE